MTDQTIPRSEAIDRMRDGLPCETWVFDGWYATQWPHFSAHIKFRKPPEPRRVARQFTITWRDGAYRVSIPNYEGGEVREVLPGDVTLQRMTEDEAWEAAYQQRPDISAMGPRYAVIALARALGLIGEGS